MDDTRHVRFLDTTLRDGEQAPGYGMNRGEKLRMALQLEALGVDVVEAGFPAASPGDFESVREIARTLRGTSVAALARALPADVDRAAEAVRDSVRPRVHVFIATSDIHLRYKLKIGRGQCLEQIRSMVAYARKACPDVEFSAEDATRTDPDFLCEAAEAAIRAGATTVNIPDTVGYTTPGEFFDTISGLFERVPDIDGAVVSVHCHDDLGLAVANTLAGLRAGARQAECCVCGIGERAGNAALEEVVMGLRTRNDYYGGLTDGIRAGQIVKTAGMLADITGIKPPPNKAIIGANAFAHESGVHQHGMLADERTYEIMTPESVGARGTAIVLGKHSGRHAVAARLRELGYNLPPERIDGFFELFKALADRKKTVEDRDLVALAADIAAAPATDDPWTLESFAVNSGNAMTSTAAVTLRRGDKRVREVAAGSGPVYAAVRAIEKIVRHPFSLEDYQLQAVTEHRDAQGEARVKISDATGVYRGRGVSTDVIEASILACLAGVNNMLATDGRALGTGTACHAQRSFGDDLMRHAADKNGE